MIYNVQVRREKENQLLYREVEYIVKEDLYNFSAYQEDYDCYDPADIRRLRVMKKSTLIGYLIAFAEELDVRVDRVRLYEIYCRSDGVCRIGDRFCLQSQWDEDMYKFKGVFYVEVLTEIEDPDFVSRLETIRGYQVKWQATCQKFLEEYGGSKGYNRLAGCGPGCGSLILNKYLPDNDHKKNALATYQYMTQQFAQSLVASRSYEKENEDQNCVLVIVKVLNVDTFGDMITPEVMSTILVSFMSKSITFKQIHAFCMKHIKKKLNNDNLSEEERQKLLQLWGRGDLMKLLGPCETQFIPPRIYGRAIGHDSDYSVESGDILCLIPSDTGVANENSEYREDEDDLVDYSDEETNSLIQLTIYLRSVVLKLEVNVNAHERWHCSNWDIINRKTGLWSQVARKLLNSDAGDGDVSNAGEEEEERQVDEVLSNEGITIITNMDENSQELLKKITMRLQFGDSSRLHVGIKSQKVPNKTNFAALQDDFFRNNLLFEKLLVQALPFPRVPLRPQEGQQLLNTSRRKYYEFYLMGASLLHIRKQWLEGVIYPRAAELYDEQIRQLQSHQGEEGRVSVFQLRRVYNQLPWRREGGDEDGDAVGAFLPVPDEFIIPDKCYLSLDTSLLRRGQGVSTSDFTVHDVVQQFRLHMGIPLPVDDRIMGPPRKKRSAEGAGLKEGGRGGGGDEGMIGITSETTEDVNTEMEIGSMLVPPSASPAPVSSTTNQLSEWLGYAENVHSMDKDGSHIMLYKIGQGKVARIFKATDAAEDLGQNWLVCHFLLLAILV